VLSIVHRRVSIAHSPRREHIPILEKGLMATLDLHVHSTGSDGAMRPSWIVDRAVEGGYCALAVTDHDTFDGVPEAARAAQGSNLTLIPGVELSVELHCGGSAHMLGYFPGQDPLSWDGGSVEKALAAVREARDSRNSLIIRKLQEQGIPITMREVLDHSGGGVTGRLHIATILVQKGVVSSTEQAFRDYLGKGAMAYVARERIGDFRALDLVRENGGIPILAHPWLLEGRDGEGIRALVASLTEGGLMGIEAFYPGHDKEKTAFLVRTAGDFDLMLTGGSDFHGVVERDVFPSEKGGFRVDSDQVRTFLEACYGMMKGDQRDGEAQ